MSRTGRPKVEVKKEKIITVRLTRDKYEKLKEYAQSHNLTVSKVLENGVDIILETSI